MTSLKSLNNLIDKDDLIYLIIILAVGIRFYNLTSKSLFIDEIYSITVRGRYPFDLLLTTTDPHPPLYYILLGMWMDLFGASSFATRGLSAIIGVATVYGIYLVGTELYSREAGLIAALLLAFSPINVQFSQIVRMYSLFVLLTLLSFYAYIGLLYREKEKKPYLGYIVYSVLLIYTHAYALLFILVQTVYGFASLYKSTNNLDITFDDFKRVQSYIAFLSIPWLVNLAYLVYRSIFGSTPLKTNWIPELSVSLFQSTILSYAGYLSVYPVGVYDRVSFWVGVVNILLITGIAILVILLQYLNTNDPIREWVTIPIYWIFIPVIITIGASIVLRPAFYDRLLLPVPAGVFVLAGVSISYFNNELFKVILVVILLFSSSVSLVIYYDASMHQDWRGAASHIETNGTPEDIVYAAPPYIEIPLSYYLTNDISIKGVDPANSSTTVAETRNNTVWVVKTKGNNIQQIHNRLQTNYNRKNTSKFGSVRVFRYNKSM